VYEDFVIRANIERFRRLLTTALDDDERRAISELLASEAIKLRGSPGSAASGDVDVPGEY